MLVYTLLGLGPLARQVVAEKEEVGEGDDGVLAHHVGLCVVFKVTPGRTKKKKEKAGEESISTCDTPVPGRSSSSAAEYQFHQAREAPLMWQMTM